MSTTFQDAVTAGRWRVAQHEQGAWINVPFSAGNFTADTGSWSVSSGDVATYRYWLNGRTLILALKIDSGTASGGPTGLAVALPTGFTMASQAFNLAAVADGSGDHIGTAYSGGSNSIRMEFTRGFFGFGTWAGSVAIYLTATWEVQ